MRSTAPILLALVLAACASDAPPPAAPRPAPPPPRPAPPPVAVAPPPPISMPPAPDPNDTCGLAELGDLVGKPRTSIPVPLYPSRRRVVCTGCPVTMDYSPQRQTIEYDPATGLVTKMTCG